MKPDGVKICSWCMLAFAGRQEPGSINGTCPECQSFYHLHPYDGLARDLRVKCRVTPAAAKILETEATSS